MITIQISTNIIKASTYTDLLNTFLQSNDTQFIKMQNAAQKILENKFENHLEEDEAKYIWNQILDYYPKVEIKGILYDPLKQWYKVEIYNKDTKELYNAKYSNELYEIMKDLIELIKSYIYSRRCMFGAGPYCYARGVEDFRNIQKSDVDPLEYVTQKELGENVKKKKL